MLSLCLTKYKKYFWCGLVRGKPEKPTSPSPHELAESPFGLTGILENASALVHMAIAAYANDIHPTVSYSDKTQDVLGLATVWPARVGSCAFESEAEIECHCSM